MTNTPEVLDLHPAPHPVAPVHRAGFSLDHPYLERCWTPIVGPSSVLLLRRCMALWQDSAPVQIRLDDLGAQLGLGGGGGRNSPVWRTVERVVRFRFAAMDTPGELRVYTEVPPVSPRHLERLPAWCQSEHDRLLGLHLDALARSTKQTISPPKATNTPLAANPSPNPSPHIRMAQRLQELATTQAAIKPPSLRQ